ncbi:MAG: hypothetical protein JWM19_3859 [Actinomycetia bacterium]|nr:hypothetical protein [Actinomycetes bacterium]
MDWVKPDAHLDDVPDPHIQLDIDSDADGHADAHHVVVGNRDALEHLDRRMLIGLHPVPGRDPCAKFMIARCAK